MTVTLDGRFLRLAASLPATEQAKLFKAILELKTALADPHRHTGLGIRRLRQGLWELRVGLDLRAIFQLESGHAVFAFLGSHDEVQRYLRSL